MVSCGQRLSTCAALVALPVYLTAQDASPAGGMQLTFGVSQNLGVNRNPDFDPGNTAFSPLATTNLSFGYLSETRTDRLSVDLATGLRIDDTGTRADAPVLSFGYARTSADADLSLSGSIQRRQANTTLTLADITASDGTVVLPVDVDNLNLDGTLTRAQIGGTLTWGKTAPIGYSLGASVVAQRYDGDAATVRDDSHVVNLDGGVRMDITPVLQANFALRYARYDIDDGSDPTGRLSGSVGLSFDQPTGAISATLNAQDTDAGIRLGFQTARTFSLPNTTLTAGVGLSLVPEGGTEAVGQLSYSHTLPRGQVNLAASRSFVSASDGTERQLTTASASYAMPLTPLSSLQISFDLAETRDDEEDAALSATLQAAQSFQLTQDWALSAGARAELRKQVGTDTARRDSVFVSLGRNFTWRP